MPKNHPELMLSRSIEPLFDDILQGRKTLELRPNTLSYQKIQVGDEVAIICGTRKVIAKVIRKTIYENVFEALNTENIDRLAPGHSRKEVETNLPQLFKKLGDKYKRISFIIFEIQLKVAEGS